MGERMGEEGGRGGIEGGRGIGVLKHLFIPQHNVSMFFVFEICEFGRSQNTMNLVTYYQLFIFFPARYIKQNLMKGNDDHCKKYSWFFDCILLSELHKETALVKDLFSRV